MDFFVTVSVAILTLLHTGQALNANFSIEDCLICPQDIDTARNLTYECTAVGSGFTTWAGSAFDCTGSGNEILLSHSRFDQPGGASGQCNNGDIVGRSVGVENTNCYTSQLQVAYSRSLLGRNVVCEYQNLADEIEVIGNITIATITEPLPPPERVTLSKILPGPPLQLTFNWTRSGLDCQRAEYLIEANDCGSCPTSVAVNTTPCILVPLDGRECSFTVRTRVCGNLDSAEGSVLLVRLRAPDAPTISEIIPTYSFETGQLSAIETKFTEPASFNITNAISGSATSYTVTYTDSVTAADCGTETVLASSCQDGDGTCTHFFDVSTSMCDRSARLNVAVSATNVLGEGQPSSQVLAPDVSNNFVDVALNLSSSAVICTFPNQGGNPAATKTCSLAYYRSQSCETDAPSSTDFFQTSQSSSDVVRVGVPFVNLLGDASEMVYCFVITANDGSRTTVVKGALNRGCDPSQLYDGRTPSPSNKAVCDPPLMSIAVEDGFACYSGSFIGAAATYHCLQCDQLRSVRICQEDGTWNGTALQCSCPVGQSDSTLPIVLGVLLSVVLILLVIAVLLAIGYFCLVTKRRETNAQVDLLQARVTELSTVYEDLDNNENMETVDNRAYKTVPESSKLKEAQLELPDLAYDVCRNTD